ncbi:DUF6252 family protein [Flavobacterium sp. NRK F10]|uniref:DUF6252 family protein n=1 Tax=Flavobacterium sp. NRK F10 TaxID=2954931 RepID=UPI0020907B64|nr:DUF6252 family protein [Flavobacterium sp. NRK F10]MCO6175070.1 DUF6252 family protein [Flavobacterium sp. NRK F10]
MKKLLYILPFLILSCSSDDGNNSSTDPQSQYAMTAKINGVTFEANNPFGNNMFSSTNIWNYFPEEDFVMIQGRQGGIYGNPEINIWLKRSDITIGTYTIGTETYNTPPSHFIDLIDNSNDEFESTVAGTIIITEVNTTTKIVKGTFQFTTSDNVQESNPIINYNVTDGTFRYQYEE